MKQAQYLADVVGWPIPKKCEHDVLLQHVFCFLEEIGCGKLALLMSNAEYDGISPPSGIDWVAAENEVLVLADSVCKFYTTREDKRAATLRWTTV
jgi:hypothetical protein